MNDYSEKVKEIEETLVDPDGIDLWKLREACLSDGGLVYDSLRRRVWPLLVGLPSCLPPYHQQQQEPEQERQYSNSTLPQYENFRSMAGGGEDDDSHTQPQQQQLHVHFDETQQSTMTTGTGEGESLLHQQQSSHEDVSLADSTSTLSRTNIRRPPVRVRRCVDHYQIDLDVARCTWHLLTGDQRAQRYQMEHKRNRQVARIIRRKQRRLGLFINLTLVQRQQQQQQTTESSSSDDEDGEEKNNKDILRYYQGFHDVACIFLTTLASGSLSNHSTVQHHVAPPALELPARVLDQVSRSHLRDYLKENFVDFQTALRLTVFPMIAVLDPAVHDHLYIAEMEPFFCLSWVITWFAHEVRDSALVKRLFDAFLVGHPLLPLYVSIAMVLHPINRKIILETEADFAILHQTLRGLPRNSSMVGWKYRPGDGYVSDDEDDEDTEDDEEEAAAVEARLDAAVDGDIHQLRSVLDREGHPPGATSSVSTGTATTGNASESHARVPFQELMDLALKYMTKIPPRELLATARRYYGKAYVKELLDQTNSIEMLADLPDWSIQPTLSTETPSKVIRKIIQSKKASKAVIALGLGFSVTDRRRRRRVRFWIGVVTVALVAMAVAWPPQEGLLRRVKSVLAPSQIKMTSNTDSSCPSGPENMTSSLPPPQPPPRPPLSEPVVGSAVRNWGSRKSFSEAIVDSDGNNFVAKKIPNTSLSGATIPDGVEPPAPRSVTKTVSTSSNSQPARRTVGNVANSIVRKIKSHKWVEEFSIKWLVPTYAQERLQNHMGKVFNSFKPSKLLLLPSSKKEQLMDQLNRLTDVLNKPFDFDSPKIKWGKVKWEEIKRWTTNPLVSVNAKIIGDWLNEPFTLERNKN